MYYGVIEVIFVIMYDLPLGTHLLKYVMPALISTIMKLQYFLSTEMLCNRFAILNGILVDELSNTVNAPNAIITGELKAFLENVMDAHNKLSWATRNLNRYYSLQLLISFASLSSLIIVNVYEVIFTAIFGAYFPSFGLQYPAFKLVGSYLTEIFLLIVGSSNLANEVSFRAITADWTYQPQKHKNKAKFPERN